ncbi:DUF2642 domain-containing protein [Alicyclobacillus acidoterrestris]|uniref:YuzF family protein n=1 Tax=Alicyclobacillus acidoterrestris (strain ATCC 49025 / DSM 3922 / CIP 106132 / NCIMB 13137 / GD3B) TaxID=1356854 RepID=T0C4C1_ALIAG|nr:DUF2642 domain-containing protein [Alicyclobacillus acidoterrestris]EPZ47410.1 hypothetical protein N007_06255 [Alicyclobacillus acidoterrestris ATCC 49025]UNO48307.1 YuzF family protein [Alicyclobacillus acidoterrestris]
MALNLSGDNSSQRIQQLVSSLQQTLNDPSLSVSAEASIGGTNILGSLETLLANLTGGLTGGNRTPRNIRQVLLGLLNQNVTITTPFEPVTGTLTAVQRDYVVVIETTGNTVLIPIAQIESVTAA